uniref:Golgi apparatus membrane protein TVP23 homolog n=1 Tax=Anopheles atroparvus TaxID=41427 RepID=A0A182INS4_ANOAO
MASASVFPREEAALFDEAELNPQEDGAINRLTHPYVAFFHVFFRSAAIATYLFCGWFSDSFVTSFVFVVLLLSADFWTVKNITGRLLAGLRWWNYVDDDGVSHWVFESKKGENYSAVLNPHETRIFWMALAICPVVWAFFFVVALFGLKLKWLLLVFIALVLNGANLYGFVKCNFGTGAKLGTTTSNFLKNEMLKNAVNIMKSSSSSSSQHAGMNRSNVV